MVDVHTDRGLKSFLKPIWGRRCCALRRPAAWMTARAR